MDCARSTRCCRPRKAWGLGVADIDTLVQAGLLAEAPDSSPAAAPAAMPFGARLPQERYRYAYPVAVALTGKLGLSGFRLNLSVEAATSFDQLAAVAPKIRDAVGPRPMCRWSRRCLPEAVAATASLSGT